MSSHKHNYTAEYRFSIKDKYKKISIKILETPLPRHSKCSLPVAVRVSKMRVLILGSLSTRVFEARTATGREHFACQNSGVSQISILISNGVKILDNVNVVV